MSSFLTLVVKRSIKKHVGRELMSKTVLGILFIVLLFSGGKCSMQERKLYNDLLLNYNVLERPEENHTHPVLVKFAHNLMSIVDVNQKTGTLKTNIWITMEWNDVNLKWNPETYGNISNIRIPPDRIWRPDIYAYNSVDPSFSTVFPTDTVVKHDGNITYIPPGIYTTSCKMSFTWYLFDEQRCTLKFGSWTYDGAQLDLQLASEDGGDLSSYVMDSEWIIEGMPGSRNAIHYACCPDPYVDVTFTIRLIRNGTPIYAQARMFNWIIMLTLVLSFLLSPASAQKLTLALASIAMSVWITSALQAPLPQYYPCILVYYFASLTLTSYISLVINVMTFYLFHKTGPMPNWARELFIEKIGSSLQLICPSRNRSKFRLTMSNGSGGESLNAKDADRDNPEILMSDWSYFACMLNRFLCILFICVIVIFYVACFPTFDIRY